MLFPSTVAGVKLLVLARIHDRRWCACLALVSSFPIHSHRLPWPHPRHDAISYREEMTGSAAVAELVPHQREPSDREVTAVSMPGTKFMTQIRE